MGYFSSMDELPDEWLPVKDKTILIIGGTGSFGQEFLKKIASA